MRAAALRERAFRANTELAHSGLVTLSFGNASAVDREAGLVAIKPSGVPYADLDPMSMGLVALEDGRVVEGSARPSSDTPTHLVLYRRFPAIGGVVHTHSSYAVAWAQAERAIPCFGTTHADHFHGSVPVTRRLSEAEISGDYERETGEVVAETFEALGIEALECPAVLVASHGPFTWGPDAAAAVANAIALEAVAAMALHTIELRPGTSPIESALLERHFGRKHGPGAYYGQVEEQAG